MFCSFTELIWSIQFEKKQMDTFCPFKRISYRTHYMHLNGSIARFQTFADDSLGQARQANNINGLMFNY